MNVEEKENIFNCVIIPDSNWKGFHKVAQIIEENLGIQFKQKLDDFDSFYWILDFEGVEMNLHYHELLGDVELFTDKKDLNNKRVLTMLVEQITKHVTGQ